MLLFGIGAESVFTNCRTVYTCPWIVVSLLRWKFEPISKVSANCPAVYRLANIVNGKNFSCAKAGCLAHPIGIWEI